MTLVGINQMLHDARQQGYAVPGFCVWNAEMIRTTLQMAAQHNAPIILMGAPSEFPLLPRRCWAGLPEPKLSRSKSRSLSI